MKNAQLEAGLKYMRQHGYDSVPEKIILGLFSAMSCEQPAVYEVNDFVVVYQGMGEIGHGTVKGLAPNGYSVEMWTPDPEKYPVYTPVVSNGDMRGLSSVEEAMDYYLVRSGQKK